jgi:hypothetical protein
MGAPTSEVGYTSATTRRGDNEVYIWACGGIGKNNIGVKAIFSRPWEMESSL